MTIIEASSKQISFASYAPDLIQSCKLFSPGVVDPVSPGDPGNPPNPDTWIPLPPGVDPDDLPPAPTIVDTSPSRMIGCIVSTGANAQIRLNALFPAAIAEDGVIERATNDIWVLRNGSWVNVGPNPGPTIVIDKPIRPFNEKVFATGLTRTQLFLRSLQYALEIFADLSVTTSTKLAFSSVLPIQISATATIEQKALIPRRIGESERISGPMLSSIAYSQSSIYSDLLAAADAVNMQDRTVSGNATGTSNSGTEYVQMDLGQTYTIDRLIIGTATTELPGGWDKSYTEDLVIQCSDTGTIWTDVGTTGTFPAEGIYQLEVNFTARYVRIVAFDDYLALTELYVLSPQQEGLLDFGRRIYVPSASAQLVTGEPLVFTVGAFIENPPSINVEPFAPLTVSGASIEPSTALASVNAAAPEGIGYRAWVALPVVQIGIDATEPEVRTGASVSTSDLAIQAGVSSAAVLTGASVTAPSSILTVNVSGQVEVGAILVVNVEATAALIAASEPTVPTGASVSPGTAVIGITAQSPEAIGGGLVTPNASTFEVNTFTPSVVTGGNYYADYSIQTYGWQSDLLVDL